MKCKNVGLHRYHPYNLHLISASKLPVRDLFSDKMPLLNRSRALQFFMCAFYVCVQKCFQCFSILIMILSKGQNFLKFYLKINNKLVKCESNIHDSSASQLCLTKHNKIN